MQTVGIIGGAGFIGSWVTRRFLPAGHRVKVSATDIQQPHKYEHLKEFENAAHCEVVPMDLLDVESVKKFVQGCEIIVHGGTPFTLDVKDPQAELFEPTVKGTRNFLDIVSTTTGISKVVMIASVAAWNTSFPLPPVSYATDHLFSEADTPYFGEHDHPYAQAKFLANQAVIQFIETHPDLPFEITTLSPVFVVGESLSTRQDSTSIGMLYLFKNKLAPNPFVEMMYANDVLFALVDVRDVAEAVYQAATRTGLHGKNYLVSSESFRVSDISRMLNNESPLHKAEIKYDNSRVKKELELTFNSAAQALHGANEPSVLDA